jgi:amino acid permease
LYIINTIMGSGIVAIPIVFKHFGIIFGVILMILFGILPYYCAKILLLTFRKTGKSGYSMFGKIAYGNIGSLVIKLIIFTGNFGVVCSYFRIISDFLVTIVSIWIKDKDNFFVSNWHSWFYIVLVALLMSLIVFREKVEALKVSLN